MVSSFEGPGNGISERLSDFAEDTQLINTEAGIGAQVCLIAEPVLALFTTWRWVRSSGMDTVEMLREEGRGSVMLGRELVVLRFRSRRYTEEGWMEEGFGPWEDALHPCSLPHSMWSSAPGPLEPLVGEVGRGT